MMEGSATGARLIPCLAVLLLAFAVSTNAVRKPAVHVVVGGQVLLPCQEPGHENDTPGWLLQKIGGRAFISTDGPFLSGRGKVFPNGTLLITDLRLDESQDLTCSIVGPGGVHEETIPLVVFSPSTLPPTSPPTTTSSATTPSTVAIPTTFPPRGRPDGAPRNVELTVLNDTSINVTWESAITPSYYRPTAYRVNVVGPSVDVPGQQVITRYPIFNTVQSFILIDNLRPSTSYIAYVLAFNYHGDSPSAPAEGISFTTYEQGYVPTTQLPTSTNTEPTVTSRLATGPPTPAPTEESKNLILGLGTTVFVVIVGAVVFFLLAIFLLVLCLYCKKSTKLEKEREIRNNIGSQLDMIRGDSNGMLSLAAFGTPLSQTGSVMTMPGASSQMNVNGQVDPSGNMFSPHRKRKIPRPGGVPPLTAEHVANGDGDMGMDADQYSHDGNHGNDVEYFHTNIPDYQNHMVHPATAAMGYGARQDGAKFSNMSTMSRQRFQYGQEEMGIVIPPPPARTPPPLQVGDYPQSYPFDQVMAHDGDAGGAEFSGDITPGDNSHDRSPDDMQGIEFSVLPTGEKVAMSTLQRQALQQQDKQQQYQEQHHYDNEDGVNEYEEEMQVAAV